MNKIIKKIKPYKTTSQDIWKKRILVKADWNESEIFNPRINDAIIKFIDSGKNYYYPDTSSKILVDSLLNFHTSVKQENILVYNGSDSALDDILRTFLNNKDVVSYIHPEYSNFTVFAKSCGADLNKINYDEKYNYSKIKLELKKKKPKLFYISRPNNPTGDLFKKEELVKLIMEFSDTIFVIDEAYIQFSYHLKNDQDYFLNLSIKHKNIIVTRTFSKLYSIAGLRVGYIISNEELIKNLEIIHKKKNNTMISQIAASICINDFDFYMMKAKEIINLRENFIYEVSRLDFVKKVNKSFSNFVTVYLKFPSARLIKDLLKHKIYIRNQSKNFGEEVVRITIGEKSHIILNKLIEFNEIYKAERK